MFPADSRPFLGLAWAAVVLPETGSDLFGPEHSLAALLRNEEAELVAELGCPVRFVAAEAWRSAPAACLIGPSARNTAIVDAGHPLPSGPTVVVDRARSLVVVNGRDLAEVGVALQLLREAIGSGDIVTQQSIPVSPEEIFDRLKQEVRDSYPAFSLRGLDWEEISARHRPMVLSEDASIESLQRWFAELQDAHTWVKSPAFGTRLPYQAWIDPDSAYLTYVPVWSRGWEMGARAGDGLLDCDRQEMWQRTAATPRSLALMTGYRWFSGAVGSTRRLRVQSASSGIVEWDENYSGLPWSAPISWHVRASGTGYLRIRGWLFSQEWTDLLNAAFKELAGCQRLLVDLRGNSGGSLVAAQAFRNRFLTEETLIGAIQFSIGQMRLSDRMPIVAEPPEEGGWRKPVRFLIDRLTYSASEDAILGLGGLSNVEIIGEPSGGGSGRPRTIALPDGKWATISTALTFDRDGNCVESNGVPVQRELPLEQHFRSPRTVSAARILEMADSEWGTFPAKRPVA